MEKKLEFLKDYRSLKKDALRKLNPTSSISRGGKSVGYANLTDYIVLINEIIETHKFFWVERIVDNQNGFETVYLKLVHENGEETPESSKAIHVNENMQTNGSAQTYARRYLFMILLGIHGEADNDGEETVKQPKVLPKQSEKQPTKDLNPIKPQRISIEQHKMINDALKDNFDNQAEALKWFCKEMSINVIGDLTDNRFDKAMSIIKGQDF